jgi:hypothetical protein
MLRELQADSSSRSPAGSVSPNMRMASLVASFSADQPEIHDLITRMRRVLAEFGDRLMLGEIYLPIERLVACYGPAGPAAPPAGCCCRPAWIARTA